jgi:hypothetical protein
MYEEAQASEKASMLAASLYAIKLNKQGFQMRLMPWRALYVSTYRRALRDALPLGALRRLHHQLKVGPGRFCWLRHRHAFSILRA